MAYFTEQMLLDRYNREKKTRLFSSDVEELKKSVMLNEDVQQYDIFLSHSSGDDRLLLGLLWSIEDMGFTVYVDWEDKSLNPDVVTPQTAEVLRQRMALCKNLLYAYSPNAANSKWMPWELGYFDGLKNGKVAILPVVPGATKAIGGSEYVGLYFTIQTAKIEGTNIETMWVHNGGEYVIFTKWLYNGDSPYKHDK